MECNDHSVCGRLFSLVFGIFLLVAAVAGVRCVYAQQSVYAISNVNIIPMTSQHKVIRSATIVINGNRIVSINRPVPDSATIIDGRGKWLIPGLFDMHTHIPVDGHFNARYPTNVATVFTNTQDVMTPYVANGVTTIFELSSKAGHFGQRNEILRGDVIGPRMALAALIDGGEGQGRRANTFSDGRQSVRVAKAEGYEFIKVYSQLNAGTYKAIADEAKEQGMKVVGHIPNAFKGNTGEVFVPGFGMVAHAEEFFKQLEADSTQNLQHLVRLAKENDTWLMPTLVIMKSACGQARSIDSIRNLRTLRYIHPLLQSKWITANNYNRGTNADRVARFERIMAFNNRLVKAFKKAGIPMVAGTDAGSSGVVGGFSLHDELELLVEAGLTPAEVLSAATCLPAKWLGIDSLAGTIETGKFADLVLLNANPLSDIKNTREIAGVFVNGRWLSKTRIDEMLGDLAKRNDAMKDQYEWRKREEY